MSDAMPLSRRAFVLRGQHPDEYTDAELTAAVPQFNREELGNIACGIACVHMLVQLVQRRSPDYLDLIEQGLATGGLGPSGWIHSSLVQILAAHGVTVRSTGSATRADLVKACSRGLPSIVSCTLTFPQDGRHGGHLVVLLGERTTSDGARTVFADPSRWGATHQDIESTRFWASWSGRAIVVEPSKETGSCLS